jgi:hypothetical protein
MPVQLDEARYLDLVSRAYEAALEPHLWEALLQEIAQALQSNAAGLLLFDHREVRLARADTFGIDPDSVTQYAEHYVKFCPRYMTAGRLRAGSLFDDARIGRHPSGKRAEYYDFMKYFDLDNCTGIVIEQDRDIAGGIIVYRPSKGSPFEAIEPALLSRLGGHLRRAVRLSLEVSRRDENLTAYEALFERLPYAAVLLDHWGDVLALNVHAECLLQRTGGHISVTRGKLVLPRRPDQDRLKAAISAALSPLSPAHFDGAPFLVSCPGLGVLKVSVIMLPATAASDTPSNETSSAGPACCAWTPRPAVDRQTTNAKTPRVMTFLLDFIRVPPMISFHLRA